MRQEFQPIQESWLNRLAKLTNSQNFSSSWSFIDAPFYKKISCVKAIHDKHDNFQKVISSQKWPSKTFGWLDFSQTQMISYQPWVLKATMQQTLSLPITPCIQ